jgi:hypothetical protein
MKTRCLGVLAALLLPSAAVAQAAGGAVLQSYRFGAPDAAGLREFTLLTLPFSAAVPVAGPLGLQVGGAFAEGRATGLEGAEATLSGLTDTELGFTLALGSDRAVITAGATLPTGKSTQTLEEASVAGVMAAELLPFAVSTWGSGGGAGGDLALAFQAGRVGIGVAGGYQVAREFEPLEAHSFAYRPGDELHARVAVDAEVGEAGTFSVLVGLQRFGEDHLAGNNLFRSGSRVEGVVSYAFAYGLRSSALVYGGVYHRSKGAVLAEESALEGVAASPAQQLLTGGASLRVPWGSRAVLLPEVDLRVFRSEDGVGQGWVGTAGASLDLRLAGRSFGRRLVVAPMARFRMGHVVVREGAESGLSGWEAGLMIRVESDG